MTGNEAPFKWLRTGDGAFAALCRAITAARKSIRLETYIYADGIPGVPVRDALVDAARRGVAVRVLIDGLGSADLPARFFDPLKEAGGEVRVFSPFSLRLPPVRNHRKLLVVDDTVAITGGFNIAPEYLGDGVNHGWCDIGIELDGGVAAVLGKSFDTMWERAVERPPRFARLRRREPGSHACDDDGVAVLASGPGRGRNAFYAALLRDLETARDVRIVSAYFLPGLRLRLALRGVARRGGRVRILAPGRSDVPMSRRAGRFLFRPLLKAGAEIHEYPPQVLHAKLYLVDCAAYVGSSNLDTRSLHINHELMVRISRPDTVAGAMEWFDESERHSVRVDPKTWSRSRTWVEKLRERWCHFLLARLDPYLSRWLADDPR